MLIAGKNGLNAGLRWGGRSILSSPDWGSGDRWSTTRSFSGLADRPGPSISKAESPRTRGTGGFSRFRKNPVVVRICRRERKGNTSLAQPIGNRKHELAVEIHVEQRDIGRVLRDESSSLREGRCGTDHARAAFLEQCPHVVGDDEIVFDHEDTDIAKQLTLATRAAFRRCVGCGIVERHHAVPRGLMQCR